MDVLYVPNGFVTSIQSVNKNSELLVMADAILNENNDEYRFPINYFKLNNK